MNKKNLLLALAGTCLLAACAPVTREQTETTKQVGETMGTNEIKETISFEEAYNKISDSDTSIKLQLTDKVSMDGVVTSEDEYGKTMGLYNYRRLTQEELNEKMKTISSEKLRVWINDYYGETAVKENEVYEGGRDVLESDKLRNYMGNVEFNINGLEDSMPMSVLTFHLTEALPSANMEEGTEELKAAVDEIITQFPEMLVGPYSAKYTYLHVDDSVYEDAQQLAKKNNSSTILENLEPEKNEYYCVIVNSGFSEYDIPLTSLRESIDVYDGSHPELYPDNILILEKQIFGSEGNSLYFLFDKDKKLISFQVNNYTSFEQEAADSVNVISAKEMIKKLQEQYEKTPPKHNIKIVKIGLTYAVQYVGTDENGVHRYCAAPAWKIQYYEDTYNTYRADCYSAATGEYVSNVQ